MPLRWYPRLVLALLILGALPGHAQRPTGRFTLAGTVRDAATGSAVARSSVCVTLPAQDVGWLACGDVDHATGAFRVDSLPAGRLQMSVLCENSASAHVVSTDSIFIPEAPDVRHDRVVSTAGCDPRPLRHIQGVFRGYYSSGFELSDFVPCVEDAWFLPSDSLRPTVHDPRRAWAVLPPGSRPSSLGGPRIGADGTGIQQIRVQSGTRRFYVEWRGRIEGPGRYGHTRAAFQIQVDSVVTVREPRGDDCRPLH